MDFSDKTKQFFRHPKLLRKVVEDTPNLEKRIESLMLLDDPSMKVRELVYQLFSMHKLYSAALLNLVEEAHKEFDKYGGNHEDV